MADNSFLSPFLEKRGNFMPVAIAAAIALARSFGLGGREAAGKHMDYLLSKLCKSESFIGSHRSNSSGHGRIPRGTFYGTPCFPHAFMSPILGLS